MKIFFTNQLDKIPFTNIPSGFLQLLFKKKSFFFLSPGYYHKSRILLVFIVKNWTMRETVVIVGVERSLSTPSENSNVMRYYFAWRKAVRFFDIKNRTDIARMKTSSYSFFYSFNFFLMNLVWKLIYVTQTSHRKIVCALSKLHCNKYLIKNKLIKTHPVLPMPSFYPF